MQIARKIKDERGDENAAKAFHEYIEIDRLKCSLILEKPAIWNIKNANIRLSGLAAAILVDASLLTYDNLEP
jgi:hypothetical protein